MKRRKLPAVVSIVLPIARAIEFNAQTPIAGLRKILLEIRRDCGQNAVVRICSNSRHVEVISW